jgi:hypothetical protein
MRVAQVSKCIDKRLMLFGFEIMDLLAIFLVLSVLNFVFGGMALKIFCVWLPTALLAAMLRFGKRGKPEKYLVHWLRFQIRPGYYSAFSDPSEFEPCPHLKGIKR